MKGLLQRIRAWLGRNRATVRPEREFVVTTDGAGIQNAIPGGTVVSMEWREVETIAIETNDSGPWGADFWWVLEGGGRRFGFPLGASGYEAASRALMERYPDLDVEAMIEALGSASNRRFVCWQRPA